MGNSCEERLRARPLFPVAEMCIQDGKALIFNSSVIKYKIGSRLSRLSIDIVCVEILIMSKKLYSKLTQNYELQ